jgi:MoaA/NifB/PqqE/SkfB family radical SAM enzyme
MSTGQTLISVIGSGSLLRMGKRDLMPDCLSSDSERQSSRKIIWLKEGDTDLTDYSGGAFPKKLLLSLISNCNLRCKHCGRGFFANPPGHIMSREMVDGVIGDFFGRVSAIRLGGNDLGEQMISPHFEHFLRRSLDYDMDIELVTSGTHISMDNAELLVRALSEICVSVEGFGANYEKVRGHRWADLQRKIDCLIEARNRSTRKKRLKISFGMTVLRQYQEDAYKWIEYARDLRLHGVYFRNFTPLDKASTEWSLLYREAEHNRFYKDVEKHALECGVTVCIPPLFPEEELEKHMFPRIDCHLPFEVIALQANGAINTCCDARIVLGKYRPGFENVISVWHSPDYISLRQSVNSQTPIKVCKKCPLVNKNPFAWSRPI